MSLLQSGLVRTWEVTIPSSTSGEKLQKLENVVNLTCFGLAVLLRRNVAGN